MSADSILALGLSFTKIPSSHIISLRVIIFNEGRLFGRWIPLIIEGGRLKRDAMVRLVINILHVISAAERGLTWPLMVGVHLEGVLLLNHRLSEVVIQPTRLLLANNITVLFI